MTAKKERSRLSKLYGSLIASFLLATFLCVFGQGIAYFLNEHLMPATPIFYLTVSTVLGLFLYVAAGLLLFQLFKSSKFASNNREFYLLILFTVGPSAAIWSLFVIVMWWG